MPLADTESRFRHADAAFVRVGWTDALVRRVESPGGVIVDKAVVRPSPTPSVEHLLCVSGTTTDTPYPAAFLDVKPEFLPPDHAWDDATLRARCLRLHVPIAIASNGHQFVSYDLQQGLDRKPRPVSELPSPGAIRARWEQLTGVRLIGDAARPLMVADPCGCGVPRPHEDAAMRAMLEAAVRGQRRVLVKVTAGAQSEGAAVLAARRLAASGLVRSTVIVTTDAARLAAVRSVADGIPGLSVLQAGDGTTLPAGTDAILLDECQHSRAWPPMQALLASAPHALHLAVAGAPLVPLEGTDPDDAARSAAILAHFGPPVYVHALADAVQDGWCGALELVRRDLDGAAASADDLFRQLLAVDGPLQRSLIICPDAAAAGAMATELASRYARWAERMSLPPSSTAYALAESVPGAAIATCATELPEDGALADLRILALLAPEQRAAMLMRTVSRAAATSPADGKILLRVLDYTGASRVVPELIRDRFRPVSAATASAPDAEQMRDLPLPGGVLRVSPAGRVAMLASGQRDTVESLGRALAMAVVRAAPTLEQLRQAWRTPSERRALLRMLPEQGGALARWKRLADHEDADDYDVLAMLGWGARARSRADRADSFGARNAAWLDSMPKDVAQVLGALAKGFAARGIDAYDDLDLLQHPDVERAGGMRALRSGGAPADLVGAVADRLLRT